jgi:hypothetical protein
MNAQLIPSELPISLEDACGLSTECWRLRRLAEHVKDSGTRSALRYAVRHISEMLRKAGIEAVDFEGRAYDPGMVPEVVEARQDSTQPKGQTVIVETVAPTITWQGHVAHAGQIIIASSSESASHESGEDHG